MPAGVRGLVAGAVYEPGDCVLVDGVGTAWTVSVDGEAADRFRRIHRFWQGRSPNIVWDGAVARRPDKPLHPAHFCLATDVGLRRVDRVDGSESFHATRIDLGPGTGLPVSIAMGSSRRDEAALWIRDQRGIAILFGPEDSREGHPWRRLDGGLPDRPVDHVAMSDSGDDVRVARVGKDGMLRISAPRSRLAGDLDPLEGEESIAAAARALEEMTFHEPERFGRLLLQREPTEGEGGAESSLLGEALSEILLASTLELPRPSRAIRQALRVWTYSLIGSVSRMITDDRWRLYRAIARLIRSVAHDVEIEFRKRRRAITIEETVADCMYAVHAFGLDVVQSRHPQDVFIGLDRQFPIVRPPIRVGHRSRSWRRVRPGTSLAKPTCCPIVTADSVDPDCTPRAKGVHGIPHCCRDGRDRSTGCLIHSSRWPGTMAPSNSTLSKTTSQARLHVCALFGLRVRPGPPQSSHAARAIGYMVASSLSAPTRADVF